MADINNTINAVNSTLPVLEPVVENLQSLIGVVQWLVGGVFGLYVVFMVIKLYEFRSLKKMIKDLDARMQKIEKKIDRKKK